MTIAGIAVAADLPPGICPRHPFSSNDANEMFGRGFATRISSVLAAFSPPVGLATRESGAEGGTG